MRRKTLKVKVGEISIGGSSPIIIQSMTNTPTSDMRATLDQTIELINTGSELVRWTIDNDKAAIIAPTIINKLRKKGYKTPIAGDFHFNGHLLLEKYPECAKALSKYRINPGNVGKGKKHDDNFAKIIKIAINNNKPVRIGVNGGSLDQELLADLLDKNLKAKKKKTARDIVIDAMVKSAVTSANYAVKLGLKKNKIILSAKMSELQDMVAVYKKLSLKCDFPLHLGLTEAGNDIEGMVSSTAALSILLEQGIGDTIRVSLTPQKGVKRSREVEVCKEILQSLGLRRFSPKVTSCPGCGRTSSKDFETLAEDIKKHIHKKLPQWKIKYPGIENLNIAVMGCVVNGPGESKHADIGISLPGKSEKPIAPVYIGGEKHISLSGKNIDGKFIRILENFIKKKYNK